MATYSEIFNAAADEIERIGHFTGGGGTGDEAGTCVWLAIRTATLNANNSLDDDYAIRKMTFQHFGLDYEIDDIQRVYDLNDAHDKTWAVAQLRELAKKSEVAVR